MTTAGLNACKPANLFIFLVLAFWLVKGSLRQLIRETTLQLLAVSTEPATGLATCGLTWSSRSKPRVGQKALQCVTLQPCVDD